MDVVYSSTEVVKPERRVTLANTGTHVISSGREVSGFSVVGFSGAAVVEASNDSFANTVYSQVISDDRVYSFAPITAAQWRVRATGASTFDVFYTGIYIDMDNPTLPYSAAQNVSAQDVQTIGGAFASRIRYERYEADVQFENISAATIAQVRQWYNGTSGFRSPFIVRLPLLNVSVYGVAPSNTFPFANSIGLVYNGGIAFREQL